MVSPGQTNVVRERHRGISGHGGRDGDPDGLSPPRGARRSRSRPSALSPNRREVWVWANDPTPSMREALDGVLLDRVVTSSRNDYVHARFALALTATTEFVALFDDDTMPGPRWLENCLETFRRSPGILGSAGVRLHGGDYQRRSVHGWHDPSAETIEVDLVGHAWFLKTEWVHYLFTAPAVTGTNGEDIELSARAWRLGGIRTYCPPHPLTDRSRWGSLDGARLGDDPVALSRRPSHLDERDRIVKAEIAAGWQPLHIRHADAPNRLTMSEPSFAPSPPSERTPVAPSPFPPQDGSEDRDRRVAPSFTQER